MKALASFVTAGALALGATALGTAGKGPAPDAAASQAACQSLEDCPTGSSAPAGPTIAEQWRDWSQLRARVLDGMERAFQEGFVGGRRFEGR